MSKRTIYYVDANAARGGNGTKERPFKTISEAAEIAAPGDEVLVSPGIYREHVRPKNAGTKDAPIVYRSEKPLKAIITGAEELKNWTLHEGTVWKATVDNGIFGSYNPYTTYVCGDWYFAPKLRHTGSVFINDLMMYESASLEDCIKGEPDKSAWNQDEAKYLWYTEQNENTTVIYANFHEFDPNKENV